MTPRTALAVLLALPLMSAAPPLLAVEPGQEAPAISLPLLRGDGSVTLADYRGKVVYVDFWASWCAPCLVSMPLLSELRDRYVAERKPFEVVAVNVDSDPADGIEFLLEEPVNYVVASDPAGATPRLFEVKGMPTAYLLDGDGTVHLVHEGFRRSDIDMIQAEIDKLLAAME